MMSKNAMPENTSPSREIAQERNEFCILILAKAPVPGFAKTRLCPPATSQQAAEIAACSLLDTLDTALTTPRAKVVVAMTGNLTSAHRSQEIAEKLENAIVIPQHGRDFGSRLVNAHLDTAEIFSGLPVVQIGMDTPQVTATLLSDCAHQLITEDCLVGMAADGGWWVLGLRDPRQAEALTEVPMSRSDTGELTIRALIKAGLSPIRTETLSDVDTMKDALKVAASLSMGRFRSAVATVSNGESLR